MSVLRANPALWLLLGVPAAAVIMGVVIVTLATHGPTDLVRDDYYKAGLAINTDLSAEDAGAALGLTGTLAPPGSGTPARDHRTRAGAARVGPHPLA